MPADIPYHVLPNHRNQNFQIEIHSVRSRIRRWISISVKALIEESLIKYLNRDYPKYLKFLVFGVSLCFDEMIHPKNNLL